MTSSYTFLSSLMTQHFSINHHDRGEVLALFSTLILRFDDLLQVKASIERWAGFIFSHN